MSMKKFYVGVKGIVHDERGYLLLKKVEKDGREEIWEVPGGRIDDNEDFKDTLSRELGEELPGIIVQNINGLKGAHRLMKDIAENTSLVLLYFYVEAILPEEIKLSEEHDKYIWVNKKADIPAGLNHETINILSNLVK